MSITTADERTPMHWSVWSKGADDQRWIVVVESVTRREAQDIEGVKRAAAAKHDVPARYVALPADQTPADYAGDDEPEWLR